MDKNKQKIDVEEKKLIMIFEQSFPGQLKFTGKILGQGGFSKIYDILLNGTITGAGKILKEKDDNKDNIIINEKKKKDEIDFYLALKGKNIIRQHSLFKVMSGDKNYVLIVMEKANLSDLNKLNEYIRKKNLLKTIESPFKDLSENLLRLYIKQIVNGLETIRKYGYVHFDLKPKNFLVTYNLGVKITDYSIMKCIRDEENPIKLPGGTTGFIAPEYYEKKTVDAKIVYKSDIFGLGSSFFTLKTNENFLDIPKSLTSTQQHYKILYQYERSIKRIESLVNEGMSEDFVELLKNMLKLNPKDRIDFEFIYRNRWVNKYYRELDKIIENYDSEEERMIMEFQKSDIILNHFEEVKKIKNRLKKYKPIHKPKKYKRKKNKKEKEK